MVKARGSVMAEGTAEGGESPAGGESAMGGGTVMGVRRDGFRWSMPSSSRVSGRRSWLQEEGWPYRLHTVRVRLVLPQSAFFMPNMETFLFIWGGAQQRYSYDDSYDDYINDD